jgi:hypothetical protein
LPSVLKGFYRIRSIADAVLLVRDLYRIAKRTPSILDDTIAPTKLSPNKRISRNTAATNNNSLGDLVSSPNLKDIGRKTATSLGGRLQAGIIGSNNTNPNSNSTTSTNRLTPVPPSSSTKPSPGNIANNPRQRGRRTSAIMEAIKEVDNGIQPEELYDEDINDDELFEDELLTVGDGLDGSASAFSGVENNQLNDASSQQQQQLSLQSFPKGKSPRTMKIQRQHQHQQQQQQQQPSLGHHKPSIIKSSFSGQHSKNHSNRSSTEDISLSHSHSSNTNLLNHTSSEQRLRPDTANSTTSMEDGLTLGTSSIQNSFLLDINIINAVNAAVAAVNSIPNSDQSTPQKEDAPNSKNNSLESSLAVDQQVNHTNNYSNLPNDHHHQPPTTTTTQQYDASSNGSRESIILYDKLTNKQMVIPLLIKQVSFASSISESDENDSLKLRSDTSFDSTNYTGNTSYMSALTSREQSFKWSSFKTEEDDNSNNNSAPITRTSSMKSSSVTWNQDMNSNNIDDKKLAVTENTNDTDIMVQTTAGNGIDGEYISPHSPIDSSEEKTTTNNHIIHFDIHSIASEIVHQIIDVVFISIITVDHIFKATQTIAPSTIQHKEADKDSNEVDSKETKQSISISLNNENQLEGFAEYFVNHLIDIVMQSIITVDEIMMKDVSGNTILSASRRFDTLRSDDMDTPFKFLEESSIEDQDDDDEQDRYNNKINQMTWGSLDLTMSQPLNPSLIVSSLESTIESMAISSDSGDESSFDQTMTSIPSTFDF